MTTVKRVLCERGLRRIPAQFSWVDQRLVFEGHLGQCDALAAALYLLLVTVADCQGLSYWGDARVARLLSSSVVRLSHAREDLMRLGLIAYERPLYQVLALDAPGLPGTLVSAAPNPVTLPPSPSAAASSAAPRGADHAAIRNRLAQVRAKLIGS